MTIPRQLGPESGPRRALPDFSRSSATVERMIRDLRRPVEAATAVPGRRSPRVLLPPAAGRDIIVRCLVAGVALGGAAVAAAPIVLLPRGLDPGRSPGPLMLLVMLAVAGIVLLLVLLGARFLLVAATTARARVEITEAGPRVVGLTRSRTVAWHEIVAVESRVSHPVHWLTAALRLRDGSRVIMPALDRHLWSHAQPSGREIRELRRELRRRDRAARAASPLPR